MRFTRASQEKGWTIPELLLGGASLNLRGGRRLHVSCCRSLVWGTQSEYQTVRHQSPNSCACMLRLRSIHSVSKTPHGCCACLLGTKPVCTRCAQCRWHTVNNLRVISAKIERNSSSKLSYLNKVERSVRDMYQVQPGLVCGVNIKCRRCCDDMLGRECPRPSALHLSSPCTALHPPSLYPAALDPVKN